MRRLVPLLVALAALWAALSPAAANAGQGAARIIHLPQGTEAEALAVGPEGNLWFAGSHRGTDAANVVGRIIAGGALDEHPVPNSGSVLGVGDLTLGPEGNMWFTEPAANRIERAVPGAAPEGFTLPTPGSRPTGIVTLGGSLWTTLEGSGRLAQINPAGSAEAFTLPSGWRPNALAVGTDGALWLTDAAAAELARKSPTGPLMTFPMSKAFQGTRSTDIVSGPDGNLWMSQSDGPYIGRLEPHASNPEYTRFELPIKGGTSLISNGPHHDIWFADGGRIGSLDLDGRSYGAPACAIHSCARIEALAESAAGTLWFAAGGTIGRFEPPFFAVSLHGGLTVKGRAKVTTTLSCRGGAAGQRCLGKLELVPRRGSRGVLGSARFAIVTSLSRKVTLNLSRPARAELAQRGRLPARLVVKLGGRVVRARNLVLHAAR